MRRLGENRWTPAQVPGCVHTDLMAAGTIPDPFDRDNESRLQWIEREGWEYRLFFPVESALLARDRIELRFEGLDTFAEVKLNGHLILNADNMFREWSVDVGPSLHPGDNLLEVVFRSPVLRAEEAAAARTPEWPGGPRVAVRKAACHFGWDWAPRFVTSGIWRPVKLIAWGPARITDFHIQQGRISSREAEMTAVCELESLERSKARLDLAWLEGRTPMARSSVWIEPGTQVRRIPFRISNPRLWWCNELGEPNLYTLVLSLRREGRLIDRRSLRWGIRELEWIRRRDAEGESFSFELNGVPVFMKGANLVPSDSFPARVSRDRLQSLAADAAAAHMNMLRVWGGGIYPRDLFYQLCDELGILVWQDFMFANALYPGDEAFLENVQAEAAGQIRRLRRHPCLAIWCGNNEIEEAWLNWGWQALFTPEERARIQSRNHLLFHERIPGLIDELDPGRPYWPSSPGFGRADPRSLSEGDAHDWSVWHDGEPFESFDHRVGRFMSEYGFQSLPHPDTISDFARPWDLSTDSPVLRAHQKHPAGDAVIREYMARDYPVPGNFVHFVYVSQLLQAEGVRRAIEAHRRARPRCMGTLYWQLNDCWPGISWSSRDYAGRWKALHHYVKNAFQDLIISVVETPEALNIHLVSDRPTASRGQLTIRLLDFEGRVLASEDRAVLVPANRSVLMGENPLEKWRDGRNPRSCVLEVALLEGGRRSAETLHYFVPPRDLDLPEVRIICRVKNRRAGCRIRLSSDRLVKNLFLRMEGAAGRFSRNYFDLLPGQSVDVDFISDERIDFPESRLKMMSLRDVLRTAGGY
jgi:beta-mannosidase